MTRFHKKISQKKGLPPGSLIHIGEKKTEKVRISIIEYNQEHYQEKIVQKIENCFPFTDEPTITWLNIDGLHDINIIEKIGKQFQIHSLILEDILNTDQRPKVEDYDNHIFFVIKMIYYNEKKAEFTNEQVSLVLGHNFVISFQESIGDVFDGVRERLRNGKGRIRKKGSDYLLYCLIDAVVDNYFLMLEKIGERIENVEEGLVDNPTSKTVQKIHSLKREMIYLRKSVWPLREVINNLQKGESAIIHKETNIFLRDLYDHTIQIIDTVETFRDMISGMLDIYMSSISNKMNEVMKVLTIFAAIFIPLTFIAGIYGMNFDPNISPLNMPELEWYFGYPFALILMTGVVIIMLIFFKRKRWL
ncbi:MAG: magnesium/cobalt transporter CorA [Thermoplasmatota archaeon]